MKHYHNVAVSWLVIMNVFVLIIIAALLLGCDKKNDYSAEVKTCISYVEKYVASEQNIMDNWLVECLDSDLESDEMCLQIHKDSLKTVHATAEDLTEECTKNPQEGE